MHIYSNCGNRPVVAFMVQTFQDRAPKTNTKSSTKQRRATATKNFQLMKKYQDTSFYIYPARLGGLNWACSTTSWNTRNIKWEGKHSRDTAKCPQAIPSLLHDFSPFYLSRTLKSAEMQGFS